MVHLSCECFDEEYLRLKREEQMKRIMEHPCIKCDVGIYQKFPHPIYYCGKDGHEAMAIIDFEQMLDHLHNKCPLEKGE